MAINLFEHVLLRITCLHYPFSMLNIDGNTTFLADTGTALLVAQFTCLRSVICTILMLIPSLTLPYVEQSYFVLILVLALGGIANGAVWPTLAHIHDIHCYKLVHHGCVSVLVLMLMLDALVVALSYSYSQVCVH
jgi:hypothetical protein